LQLLALIRKHLNGERNGLSNSLILIRVHPRDPRQKMLPLKTNRPAEAGLFRTAAVFTA